MFLRTLLFGARPARRRPYRTRTFFGRRPVHEMLEARRVLSAAGFAGNDCAPELDLSAIVALSPVAIEGQAFTLNLQDPDGNPATNDGATLIDLDVNGNPTGDRLRWLADPDTGVDFPSGATLTTDGVFQWTPPSVSEPTQFVVTILGIDRGVPALADAAQFTLTVLPGIDLVDPDVDVPAEDFEVNVGDQVAFTARTTETFPAGEVQYSIASATVGGTPVTLPAGTLNPTTGAFDWTPDASVIPAGQRTAEVVITLTAAFSDAGLGGSVGDSESFTVTVHEINQFPNLASIADLGAAIGVEQVIAITATDPNALDTLEYYLDDSSPDNATITKLTNGSAEIRWTPTAADFAAATDGRVPFRVIVVDDGFLPLSDTEDFTVGEVNSAPTIDAITPKTVAVGTTLQVNVTFGDPNSGQSLTASLSPGAPDGVQIISTGANSAQVRWAPTDAQAGTSTIGVTVTDNGVPMLDASTTFDVFVRSLPVLATISDQSATVGRQLSFGVSATDTNVGEELTFSLDAASLAAGVAVAQTAGERTAGITWTPAAGDIAGRSVTVTVTDATGLADSQTINIAVAEADPPSVLTAPSGTLTEAFTSIAVLFDEPMGSSAFNVNNYGLEVIGGPNDGQMILLLSASQVDSTTVVLAISGGQLPNGTYRLTLDNTDPDGIADVDGDLLVGQRAFAFMVEITPVL
ncbi:Ig domain-containing protein [Botrimarina hoheduenensis]|uniref:Uncharacterized protein n=1 Tax=Botrimarina hoheduenensis TaxID=2528000 RepID=A0A5C5VQ87_9BACT|nr:Ig domain-containing protein [Botrimarina hoheduenensis]TWT40798.1 hypothetical protein Pla111_32160 [Botrimarina hoheduenensis]